MLAAVVSREGHPTHVILLEEEDPTVIGEIVNRSSSEEVVDIVEVVPSDGLIKTQYQ